MRGNKIIRRIIWFLVFVFILFNVIAYLHAWKLTHFTTEAAERTTADISTTEKLKIAFTGVNNPRPVHKSRPLQPYETHYINSNKKLECWLI